MPQQDIVRGRNRKERPREARGRLEEQGSAEARSGIGRRESAETRNGIERRGSAEAQGGIGWRGRTDARKRPKGQRRTAGPGPPDTRDYRVYRLSVKEWLLYGSCGIGACGAVAYTFYRSFAIFLLLMPLGMLYPLYKKRDLRKERLRRLGLQFKEGILVLASFLGAGYSLENALAMGARELEGIYGKDGMITEEFGILIAGIRMNQPAEQLLMEFGARSGLEDVDHFAQVFAAARRSGGELVGIINYTAGIIRDKVQVQEEIHTMTAARMFEQKIMDGIPFLIVLYIDLTSPGFFRVMYETMMGRAVMTLCLAVYAGALLLSKSILEIEV